MKVALRAGAGLACRRPQRFRGRGPTSRHRDEFVTVLGPIVKSLGIEIRPVRPLDRSEGRIEFDFVENLQVLERRKHVTLEHRSEVDSLMSTVVKPQVQGVRPHDFEPFDAMNGVPHVRSAVNATDQS